MKKIFCAVLLVWMLTFVLGAAAHADDADISDAEENCTIEIIATLTVVNFDGEEVKWRAAFGKSWVSKPITAGSHTFVLDYRRNVQGGTHYQNGIAVNYDKFVAGHTYEMVAAEGAEAAGSLSAMLKDMKSITKAMNDTVNQTLRIGIRDITDGRKGDFEWLNE